MSSRFAGDADEPSMARLSLRPRPRRRPASMPAPPPPFNVSRDRPWSPPPPPSSYASAVRGGLHTPPQPHHQEESGWESELDSPISPPRIVFINATDEEPGSPTSPPGSPPPVDVKPAGLPKRSTFGSNTEKCHSSDGEDDPYFKSLVDNFMTAAADVLKSTFPEDDIDDMKANHQLKSNLFAETALKHYNNDEKNKIKFELISAVMSCGIMDAKGCYGHVNFTAKGNQQNSKEELFFAELRWVGYKKFVPTCVLSLKGAKKVGGLRGSVHDKFHDEIGFPMDAQHCYACGNGLKHPKNGALYEAGHAACSDYYHG